MLVYMKCYTFFMNVLSLLQQNKSLELVFSYKKRKVKLVLVCFNLEYLFVDSGLPEGWG